MIKKAFRCVSLKTQLALLFFFILLVSFTVGTLIIYAGFSKNTEKEVGEVALQTVNALESNLNIIFENVTQFSNLIFFDNAVQNVLKNNNADKIQPKDLLIVQNTISNMLLSAEYIFSVVLINSRGNYYKSYKVGPIAVRPEMLEKSEWYAQLRKSGNGRFIHKSDGIIDFPLHPDKNYISYVRAIPDKFTYEYLASLLLVINEETVQNLFRVSVGEKAAHFCIVDQNGNYIVRPENNEEYFKETTSFPVGSDAEAFSYRTVNRPHGSGILVQKRLTVRDWILVGFFPLKTKTAAAHMFRLVIITFALVDIFLICMCTVLLHRILFNPLLQIQKHMQLAEEGIFVPMEVQSSRENEITTLQKANNYMICSIRDLIEQIKREEKIIAKNELDIIYAQINPHFLYNTLDAASALCLMRDTNNCYKLLRALGSFYRSNLNSGCDLVSVADEIEGVKNYVTTLNIRYDGRIYVEYDIAEDIRPLLILKLILQPIIENAVYHGIKEREGNGRIVVKGFRCAGFIFFEISDNGVGMERERIDKILKGELRGKKSGFGIYSLIQRVSLYYCLNDPVSIESKLGEGTVVTVKLKVIGENGTENLFRIDR